MKKLFFFSISLIICSIHAQEIRNTISLEGLWNFRIDSEDVGISGNWYKNMARGTINLPGSMTENGLGDEVTPETEWTGAIVDR